MILLGSKVKDAVSGFKGTAISRIEYMNGCVQYGIKPSVGKDGKDEEAIYIDEGQLEIMKAPMKAKKIRRTGGPSPDAPKGNWGRRD